MQSLINVPHSYILNIVLMENTRLTLDFIEAPLNAFENPDNVDFARAAWSGSTLFAF